jgi:hypothetical protein
MPKTPKTPKTPAPAAVPAMSEADAADRDLERRAIAPMILARLLGSRAACEEIKARAAVERTAAPFAVLAARAAIVFADALMDELTARAERERRGR